MWQSIRALVLPAAQSRLMLVVNHVLSREPVAMQRLVAHAGRRLSLDTTGLPTWLPAVPPLVVEVTPAGLFDLAQEGLPVDLTLHLQAPAPQQWLAALAGDASPQVQIEGDAALAGDMRWLVDNLRWDVEADVAEVLGPTVAHQIVQLGRAAAAALRRGLPAGESAPR